VTIGSEDENLFLSSLAPDSSPASNFAIGLIHEGAWVWTTGELVSFTKWCSGEPNNTGGIENCAEYEVAGTCWNDIPCDAVRPYACEK
jgi:hypothetical protein